MKTKAFLFKHYVIHGKTIQQVADLIGRDYGTTRLWLIKRGVPIRKKGWHSLKDLTGKRFGKLSVIRRFGTEPKSKKVLWEARCDCGGIKSFKGHNLTGGFSKSCGCINTSTGKHSFNWKGHGDISGLFWYRLKKQALQHGREFDLTIEYIWDLFLKQNRKCAISGVALQFSKSTKTIGTTTASIDRIDSSKGYSKSNIQWVHKTVNAMKSDLDQYHFIEICKTIAKHQATK